MIYLNYEKAQGVFDSHDPLAVTIAQHVHSFMISEEMRFSNPFRPSEPFDMCYFYFSLVRAAGTFLGRKVHTGLEAEFKVFPFDPPEIREETWRRFPFVQSGLAAIYLSQVEADSQVGGADFDLGFACAVACRSINAQVIAAIQSNYLDVLECTGDDFDHWLEGFNT
jgi:hypothetical protein